LVELILKVDKKLGRIYLKKDLIRDMVVSSDEVGYIGNKFAGVLFPKGVSYQEILRSLRTAIEDIEHRAELERKGLLGSIDNGREE